MSTNSEAYTPSTEEVREQYWAASGERSRDAPSKAEFDRWLAQVVAEARAVQRETDARIADQYSNLAEPRARRDAVALGWYGGGKDIASSIRRRTALDNVARASQQSVTDPATTVNALITDKGGEPA